MIDTFLVVKWIHIVSSTVLFGTGMGTAFHMAAAYWRGNIAAQKIVAENVVLADWIFTATSGVVQPASGLALIVLAGYGLWESWLVVSYCLYAIAAVCWIIVVFIQIHLKEMAVTAVNNGQTEMPQDYARLMRVWFWLGWPAFISLLVIFYLMIAKPTFW